MRTRLQEGPVWDLANFETTRFATKSKIMDVNPVLITCLMAQSTEKLSLVTAVSLRFDKASAEWRIPMTKKKKINCE